MSKLVIVESPAKAKTIKKYLGRGYEVVASMGHLRDLPKSTMGVDIENDFEPRYINIKGKGPIIKELKKSASRSDKVFLATDPDREGEAISWHLSHILGLNEKEQNRVTFNEITKSGIKSGMANPRKIDKDLVDAQQARRILDRLVGYKLSPFLWKKVRPGLSAGRVQSVAVKLIVDREFEIRNFKPDEYWTIDAKFKKASDSLVFSAHLHSLNKKKLTIKNEAQSKKILNELKGQKYTVSKVKKGTRKRSPSPPFTTSTLQQEASRKLNFQSARTMRIAQQLYEGVNVQGYGAIGLITYMRTDSMRISNEAREAANKYIEAEYGGDYLPKKSRVYKSKNNSQDGHEAIRPTIPGLAPSQAKDSLSLDQYKLYKLIWERFIASQMSDAVYSTVSADIQSLSYIFKASGSSLKFAGFAAVYIESEQEQKDVNLPDLEQGDELSLEEILGNQHFTQPPPRFTEASLTKVLEELGIGRPSTYVPTITTIVSRGYVEREKKQLRPTMLGEVTSELMKDNFSSVVDVSFTAKIEEDFDRVAQGNMQWKDSIRDFYSGFDDMLKRAEKNTESKSYKIPDEETDEVCEKCGKAMVIKHGRYGKFMACSGYPDCKNTKKVVVPTKGICPSCAGKIIRQKSTKGRIFFGCENYPNCNFVSWDEPISDICPKCGNTLFRKKGKKAQVYCAKEGCGYVK